MLSNLKEIIAIAKYYMRVYKLSELDAIDCAIDDIEKIEKGLEMILGGVISERKI